MLRSEGRQSIAMLGVKGGEASVVLSGVQVTAQTLEEGFIWVGQAGLPINEYLKCSYTMM